MRTTYGFPSHLFPFRVGEYEHRTETMYGPVAQPG